MSETTETEKRASLECGWCGDVAIYGDENGLFGEDDGEECLSCGWPGHVAIADEDEETAHAYWSAEEDVETTIAKWRAAHPAAAKRMDEETAAVQERWAKGHPEEAARLGCSQ